jgi:formylglycine-generating enzyme required for sulfatase activity
MSASIFISYRRSDAPKDAQAIYERLKSEFCKCAVFMDQGSLEIGGNFPKALQLQLAHCKVLLALIGPGWMDARDKQGRRRLDKVDDWVRLEIATALHRDIHVVPLLIDGTEAPPAEQLPLSLKPLSERQGLQFSTGRFEADIDLLVKYLRRIVPPTICRRPLVLATATTVATAAAAMASWKFWPRPPASLNVAVQQQPTAQAPTPTPAPSPTASSPDSSRPIWSTSAGKDQYGRWAILQVSAVAQRMRWIDAGEFMMGSPANEPQRDITDEGPQHLVRITRGFWLADTTCTQQLWMAVMGGMNPSHFKNDPHHPVEMVSHIDLEDTTEGFLVRLRGALAGRPEVLLPTETQWEYACRANTVTAFGFGPQITPEQVNYKGDEPYDGAAPGRDRKQTIAVRALPANNWGLYQMHGNVFEWCADGLRPYSVSEQTDPVGPVLAGRDASRMTRGGSWSYNAGKCRSAARTPFARHSANRTLGFRFAMKA